LGGRVVRNRGREGGEEVASKEVVRQVVREGEGEREAASWEDM
jgi:hypothetical protein